MSDTSTVPPRCEREHGIEQWPFSRRCQGTAKAQIRLNEDEDWLQVCALCLVDAREVGDVTVADLEDTDGEEE